MPPETSTIKQEISETRQELGQNITELEDKLKANWTEVKQTFSPTYQAQRYPWAAVGVSVAVGAAVGSLVGGSVQRQGNVHYEPGDEGSADSTASRPSRIGAAVRSRLSTGVGRGRNFLGQFDDEFRLVKSMVLTQALERAGSWAKQQFPAVSDSIDKVLDSALSKVKPDSGGSARQAADSEVSNDEARSNVVPRRSGLRSASELKSSERTWRPSDPNSSETQLD